MGTGGRHGQLEGIPWKSLWGRSRVWLGRGAVGKGLGWDWVWARLGLSLPAWLQPLRLIKAPSGNLSVFRQCPAGYPLFLQVSAQTSPPLWGLP